MQVPSALRGSRQALMQCLQATGATQEELKTALRQTTWSRTDVAVTKQAEFAAEKSRNATYLDWR